ncbi:unnamed protein product [Effrenium voratum]|nr:unnamed protein product [Effrenium voratum]
MPSPECVPFAQRFLASCFAGLFRPRAKAPVQLAEFERQLFGCPKCPPLSLTRAPRSGGSLLKSFCDEVLGGGTSLASLYGYLDLTQALLMLRPTCQAAAAAAKGHPRLRSPLAVDVQDIEDLLGHRAFKGKWPKGSQAAPEAILRKVTQLLRAAHSVSQDSLQILSLPFGVPNSTLRMWVRLGLLGELRELHLLGRGGPSDAGLTYLARCCPKLQRLTVLGGNSSAASSLLMQAQSKGAMSDDWWRGFRCTRLCILPRLQHAKLKGLSVQRVPSWFCGQWSPIMPTWGHEVHCYDHLGRFVCMRNGIIERVGVVRSLLPSQFGPWWELDVTFLARQDCPSQLILLLPVAGEPPTLEALPGAKEPASILRGAVVGPSDGMRDKPRKFPHPGHGHEWRRVSRECNIEGMLPWGIQEWAEAAISSGADDSVSMFFEGASSDDEEESACVTKSVEELLAQLDRDEAREWEAHRPSARVEVGSGSVPSIEEPASKLSVLRNDLEARLENQLSARIRDPRDMESKLLSLRTELEAKVDSLLEGKLRSVEDRMESRLSNCRMQIEEKVESFMGDRMESLRKECHQDAKGYVQDAQVRLSEDVASMQQRLISELRAETTLALSRESAAIAALDEQLWITDQRLGQRIDELAHSRVRERGGAKGGRLLNSFSEFQEELTEPATEAATRAKRVTGGVLAAAHQAAKTLMEECRYEDGRDERARNHRLSSREASSPSPEGAWLRSSRRGGALAG